MAAEDAIWVVSYHDIIATEGEDWLTLHLRKEDEPTPSPMQLRLDRRILGLIWARADDELTVG